MSSNKKDQVLLKLTNGAIKSFPQSFSLKSFFQSTQISKLDEEVPFEYILIYEADSQKLKSKMSDMLEFGKVYELHDARGLLKLYRNYSDQIKQAKQKQVQFEEVIKILQIKQSDEDKKQINLLQQKCETQSKEISQKNYEINQQKQLQNQTIKQFQEKEKQKEINFQQSYETQSKTMNQKYNKLQQLNTILQQQLQDVNVTVASLKADNHKLQKEKDYQLQQENISKNLLSQLLQQSINTLETQKNQIISEDALKYQKLDEEFQNFKTQHKYCHEQKESMQKTFETDLSTAKKKIEAEKSQLQQQIDTLKQSFQQVEQKQQKDLADLKNQLSLQKQEFITKQKVFDQKSSEKDYLVNKQLEELINKQNKEKMSYDQERQTSQRSEVQLQLQLKQLQEIKLQYEQTIQIHTDENSKLKQNIQNLTQKQANQIEIFNQEKAQLESNMKLVSEQYQQKSQESQQLQYQLNQSFQQIQQLDMQTVQLTVEKNKLQLQIQSNNKIYRYLEVKLESELKDLRKSSKTKIQELEQMNQKLIAAENIAKTKLEQNQDELSLALKKYKTLDFDHTLLQQKLNGKTDFEIESMRTLLREEKNKNESLNIELSKIDKLKIIQKQKEQIEQEYFQFKQQSNIEKQEQLNELNDVKRKLQNLDVQLQ